MEHLFKDIAVLENWYDNGIINLEDYLKIKSNIVDFYKPKTETYESNELPF